MGELGARRIIEQILSDPKVRESRRFVDGRFASRVYEDEPILKTGADLVAQRAERAANPERSAVPGSATAPERMTARHATRQAARQATHDATQQARATQRPAPDAHPTARRPSSQLELPIDWSSRSFATRPGSDSYSNPYARQEVALPAQYGDVRAIALSHGARNKPESWLFYEQGMLLADVEDDFAFSGSFMCYYPTYQSMSNRQLRGYISWRTKVRRGEVTPVSTSFAYVYIYELLNGIGASSPQDAFAKLHDFWEAYRDLDPSINRYVKTWLRDLVIYHGMDRSLIEADPLLGDVIVYDEALATLLGPASHTPEERFGALSTLSTYRIKSSRLYKQEPQATQAVTLAVVERLDAYYRKNRKYDLCQSLFGEHVAAPYQMFRAAVFHEAQPHADATFELDPIHRYACERGRWTCERYQGTKSESSRLGATLKSIDAQMRVRLDFPHPLHAPKTPKYLLQIIDKEIDRWLEWKRAHTPRRIDIDLSKLGGIRRAAASTREALLVDEERDEGEGVGTAGVIEAAEGIGAACGIGLAEGAKEAKEVEAEWVGKATKTEAPDLVLLSVEQGRLFDEVVVAVPSALVPAPSPASPAVPTAPPVPTMPPVPSQAPSACGLTDVEMAFVRYLLDGAPDGDTMASAGPSGGFASVEMLVDGINEKLFDALGDTAIEFVGDTPAIIEDYLQDVRDIVSSGSEL